MAVTIEKSDQITNVEAEPIVFLHPTDNHGRMRSSFFTFTQGAAAGDAASFAYVVTIPAGKVRVYLPLSRVAFSALGSARTMDIGWLAYTDEDGTAVVADPNGLDDGVDVSSAGSVIPTGTLGTHETKLFQSQSGVTLTLQINDGTIPAAATLDGHFAYVKD